MTKTLVINPPFLEPHRPPISCAIIAEVARQSGHQVTMLDINIELFCAVGHDTFMQYQNDYLFTNDSPSRDTLQNFIVNQLNDIKLEQFDWILISCFSNWEYDTTVIVAEYCKKYCSAKIVIGGPGVHTRGRELLDRGSVDYWVVGEGELALKSLFGGEPCYPGINGREPEQIEDLENLPWPNYDFFDLTRYDWLLESPDVFIYGSRGCVRRCTFCDIAHYWPKFRWRSGNNLAEEMISHYEKYGVKNFFFADSLLNGNLKEFRVFLDRLSKFNDAKKFHWGGYAIIRPKNQHPAELFDQMRDAGGKFFSVGVETGVDRIRESMKKKFSNDDIDWHLEQSQRIGLQNVFLLISSWYDETLEEHQQYLEIFKRWQNYAADGTIYGMNVNPTLAFGANTPIEELVSRNEIVMQTDLRPSLKTMAWINPNMPELTFAERLRRTVEIINEATRCNWNVVNKEVKLNEIKLSLQSYLEYKQQTPKPVFQLRQEKLGR